MKLPLIGPAYTDRSPDLNAQTCVNLFPVPGGPNGKNVAALRGTPGLLEFANIGPSAVRGAHVYGGNLFVVSGTALYKVDTTGSYLLVGTLTTSGGRVGFADNGRVMMLVDGTNGYFWNGTTLTTITDVDYPDAASQVAFLGGYFIFDKADGNPGEFMRSTLYATDATDMVDALDFATAEADPDGLVAIVASIGHLWLLGGNTTEVWYPSGADFPFDPVGGAKQDRGCAAALSAAKAGDSLLWLATDRNGRVQVVQTQQFGIVPVSTPALEFAIESYGTISDATAYSYHQEGHTFYVLTFPTAGATWAYDLTTGMWHRRAGWSAPDWIRHKGDVYAYFDRKHLVGDFQDGKLYQLDLDTYTDDGDVIRRERTAPRVHSDGVRIFFSRVEIDMEGGVGDNTTPDPQVMLDWSDDGGHTFVPDQLGSIGAIGEYTTRVRFNRLGQSFGRNFRVTISDPVKVNLIGADMRVRTGAGA